MPPTMVTYRGATWTLPDLARHYGKTPQLVRERLKRGWSLMRALHAAPAALNDCKFVRAVAAYLAREDAHVNPKMLGDTLETLAAKVPTTSPWEASFVTTLLRQGYPPTTRQMRVLTRLIEAYVSPEVAAELQGQQRLFPEEQTHGPA